MRVKVVRGKRGRETHTGDRAVGQAISENLSIAGKRDEGEGEWLGEREEGGRGRLRQDGGRGDRKEGRKRRTS